MPKQRSGGAARLILEAEHFVSRIATIEFCYVVIWICIKLLKPFSPWDSRMVNWIKEGFKKKEVGKGFLKISKSVPNFFSFYIMLNIVLIIQKCKETRLAVDRVEP